jgi:hypothetical protein
MATKKYPYGINTVEKQQEYDRQIEANWGTLDGHPEAWDKLVADQIRARYPFDESGTPGVSEQSATEAAESESEPDLSVEEAGIGLLRQGMDRGTRTIGSGAVSAQTALESGLRNARTSLTDAGATATGELRSGYSGAQDTLRTQSAAELEALNRARTGAVDPLEKYTRQGLNTFSRNLGAASQEIVGGSRGAEEAIGTGYRDARDLGQPITSAGRTGLGGLESYVGDDSPFLQRKLDRSAEEINSALASRGQFGSSGGIELVGQGAQNILENDEQQRLRVMSELAGYGVNQTGTQQNLAVNEGLARSGLATDTAGTLADINRMRATGELNTNVGLGQNISSANLNVGLNEAGTQGRLGTNVAGLQTGEGKAVADLGFRTGTGLTDLNVKEGAGVSGILSDTSRTIGTAQIAQGAQEAGIFTHQAEIEAEQLAAQERARNAKKSAMISGILTTAGTVGGGIYGGPGGAAAGGKGGSILAEKITDK